LDFLTDLESCIPSLRCYARALLHDRADADDLVQDCLERAIARRHLWYGGTSTRPWLLRILRNLYLNQVRGRRAHPTPISLDELEFQPAGMEAPGAGITLREMQAALAVLDEEQRHVLTMVALTGMTYRECALALGVPVGTVMSRLARARARLRQILEGQASTKGEPLLRRVK
jgi:RNA polymerase sigma-70 factor, ECF subfamily